MCKLYILNYSYSTYEHSWQKKDTHGCIRRSNHEIMLCLDAYKKRQIMLCKATYSFGHEKNHSNFAEFVRRKKEDWHFYFNPTGIFTSTRLFVQNHESQFCRSHIFFLVSRKQNKYVSNKIVYLTVLFCSLAVISSFLPKSGVAKKLAISDNKDLPE